MRLSSMGMMAAAIAMSAAAAPAPPGGPASAATAGQRPAPPPVQYYVDLNSASRKELMTLPGIGAAEAGKIVANRPYLTKTDLVAKGVLPTGSYLSLKHLVVAMPPQVAKASSR